MHQHHLSSLPEQHSSIEHFRKDFSLSWWFTLDVDSATGSLHVMDVGSVADTPTVTVKRGKTY
jgi:hypothetical protein